MGSSCKIICRASLLLYNMCAHQAWAKDGAKGTRVGAHDPQLAQVTTALALNHDDQGDCRFRFLAKICQFALPAPL